MENSDLSLGRGSVSLTDLRTPIVENFLSMLPMGHEKALKNAFYNVLAMVIAAVGIAASWTVYCILEPFFKPLLWALLVGTVLHPFKANLSSMSRSWLKGVKKSSVPLAVHLMLAPLTVADAFSDKIGSYVWTYWKSILGLTGSFFVTYILYYNPPVQVATLVQWIITSVFSVAYWIVGWFNWQIIFSLNVAYIGYVIHTVMQKRNKRNLNQVESKEKVSENSTPSEMKDSTDSSLIPADPTGRNSHWATTFSYGTFLITVFYLCLQLPPILLIAVLIFGFIGIVNFIRAQPSGSKYNVSTLSMRAFLIVRNIGNEGNRTEQDPSLSVINEPLLHDTYPTTDNIIPQPNSSESPTTLERRKFNRRWSEGVGFSFRPKSFDQEFGTQGGQTGAKSPDDTQGEGDDKVDGSQLMDSNVFLYGVLFACVVVQVWNRLWLLHLLPIPVVYYAIKKLFAKLGIREYCNQKLEPIYDVCKSLQNPTENDEVIPSPIRIGFGVLVEADKQVVSMCEAYLDPVVASLVLILVVIGTILGLIFASVQVYGEGDHLVRVSVNLINTTVSEYPEINNVLPDGWESIMDTMVGNAYVYGKEYITSMIRDSVADKNPEKAEHMEKQVIELWDRIYLTWNQTWDNAAVKTPTGTDANLGHGIEWDELLETGKEMPQLLEMSVLANYAKANVGTIWAIMESLWNVLIGNISLVASAVTAVLSLLFGGGTAILNLVLNLVVFFTALFYILRSKSSTYKPVELFNRYAPAGGQHAKKLGTAVEEAVNGVFVASFKMAAFYGMWTWLIHTLFEVNIVFIPSMFGALFGAVPILGPYWAAIPAVLELWFIQGHRGKAILMFGAQMAPMSVVDTQIYREIKGGGHPYLTGLAVAGGIFCFGFQGAIVGPLVLCCFFVAMKIGNSFLREGNGTEQNITQIAPHFSHAAKGKVGKMEVR